MTDLYTFAHSTQMQIILFFISCSNTVLTYFGVTELITLMYGKEVSFKNKMAFALVTALPLNQLWVYGVFAIGGFVSFSPTTYALIVQPNPVFALFYYVLGTRLLGLSKYRSVRLMRIVYLYVMILRCLGEIVGVFFSTYVAGPGPGYNYLSDALSSFTYTAVYLAMCFLLRFLFKKHRFKIQLFDSLPIKNLRYELFLSFVQTSVYYFATALVPLYMELEFGAKAAGNLIVCVILCFILGTTTLFQYNSTVRRALENKDINLRTLREAVEEFSGLKHDFFNILQTYEGYIALGDLDKLRTYHNNLLNTAMNVSERLDLAHRVAQNPEFISMLLQSRADAQTEKKHSITLRILCDVTDFYIPIRDLCESVRALLAVAGEGSLPGDSIILSVEEKSDGKKLIIINRSAGFGGFPKYDFSKAIRVTREVKLVLYKYNNVFFHGTFDLDNFFAYIELYPSKD